MARLLAGWVALLAVCAAPAVGAERGYSVTTFDRIDVTGNVRVILVTGRGPTARASGPVQALDGLLVEVRNHRLVIQPRRGTWGPPGKRALEPVTVRVTTHDLREAFVTGNASLEVDRMKAARVQAWASGNAVILIGRVEADRAALNQDGGGMVRANGRVLSLNLHNRGTGSIDARGLQTSDLALGSGSAGDTTAFATRSAKVNSWGVGKVAVAGPAACTVSAPGGGMVTCGPARP